MTEYRRAKNPGATYFFTVNCAERKGNSILTDNIDTFSRSIPKTERRSDSRLKRGERGIWQRRYWEHLIRDEEDYARHVDYIHWNPVKHGWAKQVKDWPYSCFHKHVDRGIYPLDWACDIDESNSFGE